MSDVSGGGGLVTGCSSFVPIVETERMILVMSLFQIRLLQFVRSDCGN